MIIRSQDKKRIVNFDNVEKIGIYGRFENPEDDEVNIWMVETPTACMGRYTSEKKAILVLDDIQNIYIANKLVDLATTVHLPVKENVGRMMNERTKDFNRYEFIMPQDDEVEA